MPSWPRTCLLALGAALIAPISVSLADFQAGALKIGQPWGRATPKGAQVGAGYLTVTNTGSQPDRLIGGSLVNAGRVEIHQTAMDAGVMKMRELERGLEIPPGQTVELKPGGYHIMFMDLKDPLREDETLEGTLVFEKAGTVRVTFKVQGVAAAKPEGGAHGR